MIAPTTSLSAALRLAGREVLAALSQGPERPLSARRLQP